MDYFFPVWPTLNCFSPLRTDNSSAIPSTAFTNYFTQVTNKIAQFSLTGLVFNSQCALRLCPPCAAVTAILRTLQLGAVVGFEWVQTRCGLRAQVHSQPA